MLHILYSALALCSPCYLSNDFSLSLKIFSFLFYPPSLTLHLPFTILSPPLSTSLYSHISPPLLSPCLTATCFFPQLLFHFSLLFFSTLSCSHTFVHFFSPPPGVSVSFPSCHLPGGLAVEHHHHRQLHEQVQPSVFVPVAAQTHGVEPPRGLVPPQENR